MNVTQYVVFEASIRCQYAAMHEACPIGDPARRLVGAPMSDALIVETAAALVNRHGFRGMIAWHFYGEHGLEEDRIAALMDAIEARWPAARFALWTNGVAGSCGWLRRFAQIVVTDYGLTPDRRETLRRAAPWAIFKPPRFDARREPPPINGDDATPCARMFAEMIFDHVGAVRLCCYDWRGESSIGRLADEPLDRLVERWRATRAALLRGAWGRAAPPPCRGCRFRSPGVAVMVPELVRRCEAVRDAILSETTQC